MRIKTILYSLLFLLTLSFLIHSCSEDIKKSVVSKNNPDPNPNPPLLDPTVLKLNMRVNFRNREYLIILPGSYSAESNNKYPVILGFHGIGRDYTQLQTHLGAKANEKNYILILPNGTSTAGLFRGWNAGDCCGPAEYFDVDDVQFTSKLIEEVIKTYKGDEKKIYATGFSNGAMLCYRIACELSDKIAAIAPVSGSMNTGSCNSQTNPVPLLETHSLDDGVVPYNGGITIPSIFGSGRLRKLAFKSVTAGLQQWAMINGCDRNVTVTEKEGYSILEWENCKNNTTTIHYRLNNGNHSWPGSNQEAGRPLPSKFISATDKIFDFFDSKRLN